MRSGIHLTAALALCAVALLPARAETPADERLAIAETADSFVLSVPVSGLVMTIPHGKLAVVTDPGSGGTASPRYFHLEDTTRGLIISGWFESARSYRGIKDLWKGETEAWKKKGLPKPKDVSFTTVDKWDVVLYDNTIPGDSNTHVRAEWSQLDTWIDVHISVTTSEPIEAARATAMDMLRSIRVSPAKQAGS